MAKIMLTGSFPKEYTDDIEVVFNAPDEKPEKPTFSAVFDTVDNMNRHDWQAVSRNPLPLGGLRSQIGPNTSVDAKEQYTVIIKPRRVNMEFQTSWEAEHFGEKFNLIADLVADCRMQMATSLEKLAAEFFDNSDEAIIPGRYGGDKKSVLATDHPLFGIAEGETQSNTFAKYRPIDTESVQDLIDKMANNRNEVGTKSSLMPDKFLCSQNNRSVALTTLGSPMVSESANNAINVLDVQGCDVNSIVVMNQMDNQSQWYILPKMDKNKGLVFVEFSELILKNDENISNWSRK